MACAHGLHWFALAAVGSTPHGPLVASTDGIARSPELRCDTSIGRIFEDAAQFAVFDLIGHFDAELEIEAAIIDAPAFVDAHIDTIVGIRDQVGQLPGAGLQA